MGVDVKYGITIFSDGRGKCKSIGATGLGIYFFGFFLHYQISVTIKLFDIFYSHFSNINSSDASIRPQQWKPGLKFL